MRILLLLLPSSSSFSFSFSCVFGVVFEGASAGLESLGQRTGAMTTPPAAAEMIWLWLKPEFRNGLPW